MNKNDKATWQQIYDDWNWAVRDFPELRSLSYCMKINITQPQYGPVYHFDWVAKETEEEAVQEDLKILASGYPEVGTSWSRGTIKNGQPAGRLRDGGGVCRGLAFRFCPFADPQRGRVGYNEKECRYYRAGGLQYSDEKTWLLACKLQRFFPGVLYSHEPVLGEQGSFGSNAG